MKTILNTLVALGALFATGCATIPAETSAWEYKVNEGYVPSAMEERINELADEGWIVVSSSNLEGRDGNPERVIVILKRLK